FGWEGAGASRRTAPGSGPRRSMCRNTAQRRLSAGTGTVRGSVRGAVRRQRTSVIIQAPCGAERVGGAAHNPRRVSHFRPHASNGIAAHRIKRRPGARCRRTPWAPLVPRQFRSVVGQKAGESAIEAATPTEERLRDGKPPVPKRARLASPVLAYTKKLLAYSAVAQR
ncbi:hypothetical protein TraAM80_07375, partial [Trypanosoma rangeli]